MYLDPPRTFNITKNIFYIHATLIMVKNIFDFFLRFAFCYFIKSFITILKATSKKVNSKKRNRKRRNHPLQSCSKIYLKKGPIIRYILNWVSRTNSSLPFWTKVNYVQDCSNSTFLPRVVRQPSMNMKMRIMKKSKM